MEIKQYLKKSKTLKVMNNGKGLIKRYEDKFDFSFGQVLSNFHFVPYDLKRILRNCNPENKSSTGFYYGYDVSVVPVSENRLLGNMPVDYGYLLNKGIDGFKGTNIYSILDDYVFRINDNRIIRGVPDNLRDALQMILFWNQLLWQTNHRLVGLGRLDKTLNQFAIPKNGEKLITDFLLTLHELYDYKSNMLKGDTGQIIVLGGLEEDCSYFRNSYTDLFIECLKKLNLPDPKILLRVSSNMPKDLLEKAVMTIATGIGCPVLSNDDVIISYLIDFGYDQIDAFNYGVSACWEPLSIGNSFEQNNIENIDYGRCINQTICDANFTKCKNIDDILNLFYKKLEVECERIKQRLSEIEWQEDQLLTAMMGLDKDIAYGGCKYNNYGVLSIGMSSAVNSIINIHRYVFDNGRYTLDDVQKTILNDYGDDNQDIFSKNEIGYGTDTPITIRLTNKIIKKTESCFKEYRNKYGGKIKFGLSSPEYLNAGKKCGATLDGRRKGMPFSTHISKDKGGTITEIINFMSKLEFSGMSANANVIDVMLQRSILEENIEKYVVCISAGIKAGLFQLQLNVLSYIQLVEAKQHPEKYPNLIVRVWGFSAYFNDLPDEYKDQLIKRAKEIENIN